MLKSMRIFACSCAVLVGLAPLAASAGQVLVTPDNFPKECSDDIFDNTAYSGPVSVYTVRNLRQDKNDPYQIQFQISDSKTIVFKTAFLRDLDDETIQQVDGYLKKKKGLFVAFIQPGTAHLGPEGALPVSSPESRLDFFLIASISMGNGNPPMCSYLSQPAGLPQEAYQHMPERIQLLMNWVKDAMTKDMANAFAAFTTKQQNTPDLVADDDVFK
ncbi:MAG: hypothetical protein DI628_07090 [Blastochloris viridis]|uniref:Uncharacterized protein n=1 Tax=Blastochloris viridis TaxID=1079 RepID=A0A6N4R926_BLAVI|nr:MAG: hypothetical protein DI628_07090 [Blastochloris viridis]